MSLDRVSRRDLLRLTGTAVGGGVAGCVTAPQSQDAPSDRSTEPAEPRSPPPAASGDDAAVEVYRDTIPSVVLIGAPEGSGHGSGFVFGEHLLTNYHVVRDATTVDVRFEGNEWRTARVVGRDPYADLAVLTVRDRPATASPLPVLETVPPIGTEVVVVGNPFELDASLSKGVVSGTNRALPGPTGFTIPNAVQTDAIVHPGNSGGPLLTLSGEVVGAVVGGRADGISFAISAPLIRRIGPELIETGSYDHPYLGVVITPVTPSIAEANDLPAIEGVAVVEVDPAGPSADVLRGSDDRASIGTETVPTGGDVILSIDGHRIDSTDDLSTTLAFETHPSETVEIGIYREGDREEASVTLGTRPTP